MGFLAGKRAVIVGLASNRSIAWGIAQAMRRADAVDFTETDWDDVMDVNLKAVFFLSQAFARAAFARGAGGDHTRVSIPPRRGRNPPRGDGRGPGRRSGVDRGSHIRDAREP